MSFVYKGLKARYERHIVTQEEVDHQIEQLQQRNPRVAVVKDRATQRGDEVVLDYAGYCDGVQFQGGTAENQTLVLGSGAFIPGFEEQLLDKVPEEPIVVNVKFPEEYHAKELAGKDAQFHCTIHEIHVKTTYELDDIFAQEIGGCYTFDEFRQKLGEAMQDYTDQRGEMDLKDRLLRQAAETLALEISEEELQKAVDEQMQTLKAQLAQKGLSIEMYCQFMGTTEDALKEDAKPAAEQELRTRAAVEEIVRLENLTAEEEDIAEVCNAICRQNHMTMEELKPHYDEEMQAMVVRSVLTKKAMDLIREAAEVG